MKTATRVVTSRRTTIDDLLPKFLVYFDASAGLTLATDTNISQWKDRVSGLIATQATTSAQPSLTTSNGQTYIDFLNNNTKFLDVNIPTPLGINTSRAYFCFSNFLVVCTVNIPDSVTSFTVGRFGNLINTIIIFKGIPTPEEDLKIIEFLKTKLIFNSLDATSFFRGDAANGLPQRVTEISNVVFSGITNFFATWTSCTNLTSFPVIDTSGITNFGNAWTNCTGLTSFPLIDTSRGTNLAAAWQLCTGLTSFPLIDTGNCTSFQFTWQTCSSLTSFPLINTVSGTNFASAWQNCIALTSFPLINTRNGTTFASAWQNCTGLTSFPANFFNNWSVTPAVNCFLNSWISCNSLTAQSVENILVSIAASGRSAPGSATGTQADITITYNTSTGSLSTATTNAITTLKSRGWKPRVNGTYV